MDVVLPKWGMTMQDAYIAEWFVEAGHQVEAGQVLVRVETEKVEAEVESPGAGEVLEILVAAGDTVPVGTVLARLTAR